ncbi:MAG: hypothetical protein AMXMBFR33_13450 [Candidatus Xenobia bacterium]
MISTINPAVAGYTQATRASGSQPQAASGSQDGYAGSVSDEAVSPKVAYAETAAPNSKAANMETDFLTLVAAGVCALVVFSVCCSNGQNQRG